MTFHLSDLLAALALFFVLEGIIPFLSPHGMKRALAEAADPRRSRAAHRGARQHARGRGHSSSRALTRGIAIVGKFVVIIGTQWGDEGKGKIVDLLTERAAAVARFQGGHNAGHTLVIGGKKTDPVADPVRHPARATCSCFIGNGVRALARGAAQGSADAHRPGRAGVRAAAHLAELPADPAVARRCSTRRASRRAARTPSAPPGRGIGPAYEDKVARRALRVADLFQRERFAAKLGEVLDFHNFVLQHYFKQPAVDFQKTLDEQLALGEKIKPIVADVTQALHALREQGANVLFEGAQGAMLDVDLGTYPFVTSSNTTASFAGTGTGLGPRVFDEVLGIVKAYTTRVGAGPFPTELFDEYGEHLSRVGHEFGSVTGRRASLRLVRCGGAAPLAREFQRHRACASPSSTCSMGSTPCASASATASDGELRCRAAAVRRELC